MSSCSDTWGSISASVLRFEYKTAPINTTSETPAMAYPAGSGLDTIGFCVVDVRQGDDRRQDQQRHEVHHLDERVERWPGGVLERVADGVADDRRLVRLRPLAALVPVLDVLLGVVPRATGVRQVVGHQLAGEDDRCEECAQRRVADAETDDDRCEHSEQGRRGKFTQRGFGADVDHRAVVGLAFAGHDLAVGELAADLLHDHAGGA